MKKKILVVAMIMALVGCTLLGIGIGRSILKEKDDPVRETVVYPDGHVEYLDEIEVKEIEVKEIEVVPINVKTWESDVITFENVVTENIVTEEILLENYE